MQTVLPVLSIMLPIFFGYLLKTLKVFSEAEALTLRKFVIKATVPFIVVKNLYKSDLNTLSQIFPSSFAFIILSILFSLTAYMVSRKLKCEKGVSNAYLFGVYMGNYGFLGWSVMATFFGDEGFTRAVFFDLLYWPVFLSLGFYLSFLVNKNGDEESHYRVIFQKILRHAAVPLLSALCGILLNVGGVEIPKFLWVFIQNFASLTIPTILFTIGLNFHLKMEMHHFKIVMAASLHRVLLGFGLGILTLIITRYFFTVDYLLARVILLEAILPTATMSVFFSEYVEMDMKNLSSIMTFSTLLSLVAIPLFYLLSVPVLEWFY